MELLRDEYLREVDCRPNHPEFNSENNQITKA